MGTGHKSIEKKGLILVPEHPLFEIVTTTAGAVSIRNKELGEIMHNPVGPWQEANDLYIEQSNLTDHLKRNLNHELVIYDVGLGAAANALATLHCCIGHRRPVRIVSFEIDLELLKFALANSEHFPFFTDFKRAMESILQEKYWQSSNITWQLYHGDFLYEIERSEHMADLVFYDPYSSKVNESMWTSSCFEKLRSKCKANAILFNYSQATPFRSALLGAGFFVGYGKKTGLKASTTQAACRLEDLAHPLDQRWLDRWRRSETPYPIGCRDFEQFDNLIRHHEQFRNCVHA